MSNSLDHSNVVQFVPRQDKPGRIAAHAQAVDQLATIADTIIRLEAVVEGGSPTDPLLVAARRAVSRMKEDAIRIAHTLQLATPNARGAPTTNFQKENIDAATDVGR